MYFNSKNKRSKFKKKIVLTTLTAAMLVSSFPLHQSSVTIGSSAVYAMDKQEDSLKMEKIDATRKILSEIKTEFKKKSEILRNKLLEKVGENGKKDIDALFEKVKNKVEIAEENADILGSEDNPDRENAFDMLNKGIKDILEKNSDSISGEKNKSEIFGNTGLESRPVESPAVANIPSGNTGLESRPGESPAVADIPFVNAGLENRPKESSSVANIAGLENESGKKSTLLDEGLTTGKIQTEPGRILDAPVASRATPGALGNIGAGLNNIKPKAKENEVKAKLTPEELKKQKMLEEKKKAEAIAKEKAKAIAKAKAEAIMNKKIIRIGGKNRRETALGISKAQYNFSDKVILVNQDAYADALTASVLSKVIDAPILLNSKGSISPETMYEMKRLKTKEVIILGGESSIDKNVENQFNALKIKTERIAGKDRYDTSVKVAEKIHEKAGYNRKVVVVSGENYPDAIAMSPFAAKRKIPILLVKKDSMSQEVSDFLMFKSIKNIYVAGGKSSISDSVISQLPRIEERFEGSDRYETAEKIANYEYGKSQKIFVATGEDFSDALAAGPMIASEEAPLLLVGNKGFTKGTKKYVLKSDSVAMIFIGGTKYIPDEMQKKLAEMPKKDAK